MKFNQKLAKLKKKRSLDIFSNPDLKWKKIDAILGEDVVLFEELDESVVSPDVLQQLQVSSHDEQQPRKKKKLSKSVESKTSEGSVDSKVKKSKSLEDLSNFVLPDNFSPWEDYEISGLLDNRLLKAIVDQGYTAPTPIQKKSLIAALRHRKDVIGAAQTVTHETFVNKIRDLVKHLHLGCLFFKYFCRKLIQRKTINYKL